jgi:GT2 family glycosyltransferase
MNKPSTMIGIAILFFNKLQQTIECIDSFLPSQQKIYILNNGSDQRLFNHLKLYYSNINQLIFLDSDKNLGPAKGRNELIKAISEEWIFLIDNDITIEPKNRWIYCFREFIRLQPEVNIVCPRLFNVHEDAYASHPNFIKNGNIIKLDYAETIITNYFPSGAAIVRKKLFEENGFFEENIFAFEDYEYAIRAICKSNRQLAVYHLEDIILHHDHRFQKKGVDKKSVRERYNMEKLKDSFDFIQKKYSIQFDHNWEWWSKKQLSEMTGKGLMSKLIKIIKNIIYK